jgi:hypothetical protein
MPEDFRRHLEYGRSQREGIRFDRAGSNPTNRIEDALRRNEPVRYTNQTSTPSIKREVPQTREANPPVREKRRRSYRFIPILLIGLTLLGGAGFGGWTLYKHFSSKPDDTSSVLEEVGKQVGLPTGETPTIATVTDTAPLKGQEFFKDAEVGDKVLIFSKSKKAILYRPSTKKIIVVGPVNG